MTLIFKMQKFKFLAQDQLVVVVKTAVNVLMNEVVYDSNGAGKTFITDGLGTCAAVAFCGSDTGFSTAFTHMSSASTSIDDVRKSTVLNQMLEYVLKTNALSAIKMMVSPSTVRESHLINFLISWAKEKNIVLNIVIKGGDSSVLDIDTKGNIILLPTSLKLKPSTSSPSEDSSKKWHAYGVAVLPLSGTLKADEGMDEKHFISSKAACMA